jgi:hypothetical protein
MAEAIFRGGMLVFLNLTPLDPTGPYPPVSATALRGSPALPGR